MKKYTVVDLENAIREGNSEKIEEIISEKVFTEDYQLLKTVVYKSNGRTVAHLQARYGWITEDKQVLKIADYDGNTVAHELAMINCE